MEVKQVKIGRVSNKAFLLFVVDAINSEHIHSRHPDDAEFSIDVDIASKIVHILHTNTNPPLHTNIIVLIFEYIF